MKILSLLIVSFLFTCSHAHAFLFKWPPLGIFSEYKCNGTEKVTSLSQLNNYLANYSSNKNKIKNLVIDFNLNLSTDFVITTPCQITIKDNRQFNVQNFTLHGSKGVVIEHNFQIQSKNFRIESSDEIVIQDNPTINATDFEILANNLKDKSHVRIGDHAQVNVDNFQIESSGRSVLGKDATINVDEKFGVYSQGDDVAVFKRGSDLVASVVEISSMRRLRIDQYVTINAFNELILNAEACIVNDTGTVLAAPVKIGSCFSGQPPIKRFTTNKTNGEVPLTVFFNASQIIGGSSYQWNFGDGSASTQTTPGVTHIYSRPGIYTASLKYIVNEDGQLREGGSVQITVDPHVNLPPVSQIACSISNMLLNCNGLSSYDPEGGPLTYYFDFGDGSNATSEAGVISYIYLIPGLYEVKLTVKDSEGLSSVSSAIVQAVLPENILPEPVLTCSSDFVNKVSCHAAGSADQDGTIVSYEYEFDDSASLTKTDTSEVTHTFQAGGVHTVRLTAVDNDGGSKTVEATVNVLSNADPVAEFTCSSTSLFKIQCQSQSYDPDAPNDMIQEYSWDLGNGEVITSTSGEMEYVYATGGTVSISLTVKDTYGASASISKSVVVRGNSAPVALIGCTTNNLLVSCDGLSSYDPDLHSLTYRFVYGDGFVEENTTGVSTHAFELPGTYIVTLVVTDMLGGEGVVSTTVMPVRPPNVKPIAQLQCTSVKPFMIECNASGSSDSDGSIVSYQYNWGDGSSDFKSDQESISHRFSTAGTHTVFLTVLDNDGGETTVSNTFNVKNNTLPIADFNCVPNYQQLKIKCQSVSTENDPDDSLVSFKWNLGDNEVIEGLQTSVEHLYATAGDYQIQLEVTDTHGGKSLKTKTFTILDSTVPEISFQYPEGQNFSIEEAQSFWISVTDDEHISSSSVSLSINGSKIGSAFYTVDSINNKINVSLPRATYFKKGSNLVTFSVTPSNGITATESVTYNLLDSSAPTISLFPAEGFEFVTENGYIQITITDPSRIDWATLVLMKEGSPLDPAIYVKEGDKVVIDVSAGEVLNSGVTNFSISVKDTEGNQANRLFAYNFDPSDIQFDFVPGTNEKFESLNDQVSVYPVAQEGSTLNWPSLKVYWNGSELTAGQFSIVEDKVIVPLDFTEVKTGILKVSMLDGEGKTSFGEARYGLKDMVPPVISFSSSDGTEFQDTLTPDIRITLTDDSFIDEGNISLVLNGVVLPSNNYIYDASTHQVMLRLTPSYYALIGENQLSITATDAEGNSIQNDFTFTVADTAGPAFAFTPQLRSSFVTNWNTVAFEANDISEINWQSLRMNLNGVPVPLIYSSIAGNTVIINFNPDFSFELGENHINVSLQDIWGNISDISASYFLLEKRTPQIAFTPDRGTRFKTLPQTISAKFNFPETVNWASVSIKLNNQNLTTWSKTGEDILSINLSTINNLIQGTNLLSVNFRNVDGTLNSELIPYYLDDLYTPVLNVTPAEGFQFPAQNIQLSFEALDAGGIDWESLVLKLNDKTVTSDKYSIRGNVGAASLRLDPGQNVFSISVKDRSGKTTSATRNYRVLDTVGPKYKFSPTHWASFESGIGHEFKVLITDDSGIKEDSIQVWLNGNLISQDHLSWSSSSSELVVSLEDGFRLKGGNNVIRIRSSDTTNHLSEASLTYQLIDTSVPVLAFFPATGAEFENNKSPSIKISLDDVSEIDYVNTSFFLNGVKLSTNDVLTDSVTKNFLVSLNSQSLKLGENEFKAVISDVVGNAVTQTASYTLTDTIAPTVAFWPQTGVTFNSLSQTIMLKFGDLTEINWSSLEVKLNDQAINSSNVTRFGNDVAIVFTNDYHLKQGENKIDVRVSDTSGNELNTSSLYQLEDIFPATFEFSPVSGTTLNALNAPVSIRIHDEGVLKWETLKIKLNGLDLPSNQYSVVSDTVTLSPFQNFQFFKGLNYIEIQVEDVKGNLSSVSASYLVLPGVIESIRPTIAFSVPNGDLTTTPSKISITVTDASGVDFNRMKFWLNQVEIEAEHIVKDRSTGKVDISFNETLKFAPGKNLLTVFAVDNLNNVGGKTAYYNLVDEIPHDIHPPVVTFNPSGGELTNNTPTILAFISDMGDVDFSSLQVLLNEVPIEGSLLTVDAVQGKIAIAFNATYPLPDQDSNIISVRISDVLGNQTIAKVGFDRITETNFRIFTVDPTSSSGGSLCSILEGGLLRCWGANPNGAAGAGVFGSIGRINFPSDVSLVQTGEPVIEVATASHTCTVTISGKLLCFGTNSVGQLGYGHTINTGFTQIPLSQGYVDVGEPVTHVSLGTVHTCVIMESGKVKCWGSNTEGQTGILTNTTIGDDELPSSIPGIDFGVKAIKIASAQLNTCVLLENGKIKCWGDGLRGAHGLGTTADTLGTSPSALPDVSLNGLAKDIISDTNGNSFCALLINGQVNCWGFNSDGRLGYGNTQTIGDNELPSSRGTLSLNGTVEKIDMGTTHTCAIMSTDEVRCWGTGAFEENGFNFTIGDNELPSSVPPLNFGTAKVADFALGLNTSCVIFEDGSQKCWGRNENGQAGQKSTVNPITFASLASLPPISLGGNVLLASEPTQTLLAKFAVSAVSGMFPLMVDFDGTLSTASLSPIVSYDWDFGDGVTLQESTGLVTHTYTETGVYTAKLTVKDINNIQSTYQRTITVGAQNNAPVASFFVSPDFGEAPFQTQFNAGSSFDINGSIVKYHWNFGDSGEETVSTPTINHTFQNPGVYLTTLRVEDDYGTQTSAFPQVVTVKEFNTSPFIHFTCALKGRNFSCDARGSSDFDGYITNYKWTLSDGRVFEGPTLAVINSTFVEDGNFTIELTVTDDTAGTTTLLKNYMVDSLPPVITANLADNILTKNPMFYIGVNINDVNEVTTKIIKNNVVVHTTTDTSISVNVSLSEGKNEFKVESTDAKGNVSVKTLVSNIVLDSIAPVIAEIFPVDGQEVKVSSFQIRGTLSEKVTELTVDGEAATLSEDGKAFSYGFTSYLEGSQSVAISFTDVAGNTGSYDLNFNIILQILHAELISVTRDSLEKVKVSGAPGAAKPGAEVEVSSGYFNSQSVLANADGSFEVLMDYFTTAQVTVTDNGRSEFAQISYNVDTTLAGTIQDTDGRPLPGVVVKIKDTNAAPAITNASGIFTFANPPTGDRQLIVDAQNVPEAAVGETKKFSVLEIPVSIGVRQSNVLEKVIHLAPLLVDGTELVVQEGVAATYESANVPGAILDIPANVQVNFPEGNSLNAINMIEVPKEKTTVPVVAEAEPDSVVALEPSGLTFSEPVDLTLPNPNEFPAGMQLVIYSKNSANGNWEIDGLARVSEDGQKIQTEEGAGITHFSEVYAAPLGLKFSQLNKDSKPGVDTFGEGVSTSIDFPGYKALGQEIAPKLIYKSNWAHPTVVVTNIFQIPEEVTYISAEGERVLRPADDQLGHVKTWAVPESVDVSFIAGDYHSPKMTMTGNPNGAVVTLGMDFQNQPTGVTPFAANYEIKLKRMIVRTRLEGRGGLTSSQIVVKEEKPEISSEVIPSELRGQVYIQNKKDSPVGRGWMIAGPQKIVNPKSSRLMLEESDGSVSTYVVNDKIQTLARIEEGFAGMSFIGSNSVAVAGNKDNVYQLDLETGDKSALTSALKFTGTYRSSVVVKRRVCDKWTSNGIGGKICFTMVDRLYCQQKASNYVANPTKNFVIPSPGGNGYIVASEKGLITLHNGESSILASNVAQAPTSATNLLFCSGDASCSKKRILSDKRTDNGSCPVSSPSTGEYYASAGFKDGALLDARFNTIKSIASSTTSNGFAVADYGNNRVRFVNLDTKQVTTIAGSGSVEESGSGGDATLAGLNHPQGVAYDEDGNLYVSTENGFVKKVDKSGRISNYAGDPNGKLYESGKISEAYLSRPYGLTIDHSKSYLYIADTGNNRILQVDLITNLYKTVAGNGLCQTETTTAEYGAALGASLCNPEFVVVDGDHNLLIADTGHKKIRRLIFSDSESGILKYDSVAEDNSSLERNLDGTFTRTFRNGIKSLFDSAGRQIRVVDRTNRVAKFSYDAEGKLIEQTDPVGGVISYHYQGVNGKLQSIRYEGDEREFNFEYNPNGDLIGVQYPDGTSKRYSYSDDGLLNEEIDQRNNSSHYVYNNWFRLQKIIRSDGKEIAFTDSASNSIINDNVNGETEDFKKYDQNQLVDGIKDAKGITTEFLKDESGYVSKITDGEGKVTSVERDLKGRPTKITRSDLSYAEFVYNPNNGDLLSKFDSSTGTSEKYTYDSFGNLLSMEDAQGRRVITEYDSRGLVTRKINEILGISVTYSYNNFGLMTSQTDSLGNTSGVTYDGKGNVLSSIRPDGKETRYSYHPTGFVSEVTDPNLNVRKYGYDSMNRLLSVVTGENQTTSYAYLETGELSKIHDPYNNETNFHYNNLGQLIQKVSVRGETISLEYDANGNITKEVNPRGQIKTMEYDNMNRLVKKILPDDEYNFSYDVRNNLTSVSNAISQIQFGYQHFDRGDVVNQIVSRGLNEHSDLPQATINYGYNAVGEKISMSSPVGNFSYGRDLAGRLRSITNPDGATFTLQYDLNQRLKEISSPAITTTFEFDSTGFNTKINHTKKSGAAIERFIYGRDFAGNRTSKTTLAGTSQYSYDKNDQLIQAITPSLPQENFSYDDIGNRTSDNSSSYVFDEAKQLIKEDWKYFYVFDQSGNLTTKQEKNFNGNVQNFEYSSENQLKKFKLYENGILIKEVSYAYDALGRRVEKEVIDLQDQAKSFIRRYVYDGNEILAEYDGENDLLNSFTHSTLRTDDVLSVTNDQGTFYFVKDALGSITDITNETGKKVQHYDYTSFGKLAHVTDGLGNDISSSPVIEPYFTYSGREYDVESGYYYYRARYYDANLGRFLSADPDSGNLNQPFSFNSKYIYVKNNPINMVDPLGLFGFSLSKDPTLNFLYNNTVKKWHKGLENVWNENQAEIIALSVVVAAVAVGGPLATGALIAGSISAGFTAYKGGNSNQIARSFLAGFASGLITGGLSGAAAGLGTGLGTQVALGAMGGAAGGYISALVSAQINDGSWKKASSSDIMFSIFGGALGGMIAGPMFANSAGTIASSTTETTSSTVSGAAGSQPRGYYNEAGTWTSN